MDKLKVELGGRIFTLSISSVLRHPDTLLALDAAEILSKNHSEQCSSDCACLLLSYDRSSTLFDAILNFYRSGTIHLPPSACAQELIDEIEFWRIPISSVAGCCQHKLTKIFPNTICEEQEETIQYSTETVVSVSETSAKDEPKAASPVAEVGYRLCAAQRRVVWAFLEEPSSSKFALVCN